MEELDEGIAREMSRVQTQTRVLLSLRKITGPLSGEEDMFLDSIASLLHRSSLQEDRTSAFLLFRTPGVGTC